VNDAAELIEDLQILLDTNAPLAQRSVDVQADMMIDQVQSRLRQEFNADPTLPSVILTVNGQTIGTVTPASLARSMVTAGEPSLAQSDYGAGDRIALPGDSTRYRLLAFVCTVCRVTTYRMYYDERAFPACPEHGHMRFVE
jgi:hypothetical protein